MNTTLNYSSLHLDPDEHVILEVRKHWIVFAGHAVSLLVAGFLPFIILLFFVFFLFELISPLIDGLFRLLVG